MLPDLAISVALLLGPGPQALPQSTMPGLQPAAGYSCANVSCKRLHSCAEACYKMKVCGQTQRDGDHDGIPCENLCSLPCP